MLLKHQLTPSKWGKLVLGGVSWRMIIKTYPKTIIINIFDEYVEKHIFSIYYNQIWQKILNFNPEYYAFLWQWKFHIFIMLKFQNLGLPNLGFIQLSKYQPKHSYNGYDFQWYDHLCQFQTLFMQFSRNFDFFNNTDMVLSSSNLPRIQTTNLPQRIFLFSDSRSFVIFIHSEG